MRIYEKIAAQFSGNSSVQDDQEITEWRKNPENETVFVQLAEIWKNAPAPDPNIHFDIEAAWKKMEVKMKTSPSRQKTLVPRYAMLAAAVLVPLIIGIWLMNYFNAETKLVSPAPIAKKEKQVAPQMAMIEITSGDSVRMIYLPDSTLIFLNAKSTLRYPEKFTGNERLVLLDGEAFFNVTENKAMPFIIRTDASITKVIGTSFNLMAYKDKENVELVVESGTVEFSSASDGGEKMTLQANDMGTINKKTSKTTKTKNANPNKLKWNAKVIKRKIKNIANKFRRKKK